MLRWAASGPTEGDKASSRSSKNTEMLRRSGNNPEMPSRSSKNTEMLRRSGNNTEMPSRSGKNAEMPSFQPSCHPVDTCLNGHAVNKKAILSLKGSLSNHCHNSPTASWHLYLSLQETTNILLSYVTTKLTNFYNQLKARLRGIFWWMIDMGRLSPL